MVPMPAHSMSTASASSEPAAGGFECECSSGAGTPAKRANCRTSVAMYVCHFFGGAVCGAHTSGSSGRTATTRSSGVERRSAPTTSSAIASSGTNIPPALRACFHAWFSSTAPEKVTMRRLGAMPSERGARPWLPRSVENSRWVDVEVAVQMVSSTPLTRTPRCSLASDTKLPSSSRPASRSFAAIASSPSLCVLRELPLAVCSSVMLESSSHDAELALRTAVASASSAAACSPASMYHEPGMPLMAQRQSILGLRYLSLPTSRRAGTPRRHASPRTCHGCGSSQPSSLTST
mmetsp:Transcript_32867/g.104708  ORF Transcript_32867/g.104708 Transcript_32867/m.104708 type:complete len:292 (-) Transcript_32867:1083-1958(-)